MDLNFTRFLSFSEISVDNIDVLEDAFLTNNDFSPIYNLLDKLKTEPPDEVVKRILDLI